MSSSEATRRTPRRLAAVKPSTINATAAMVTTTALLRAVNVEIFELGLWQAWAH